MILFTSLILLNVLNTYKSGYSEFAVNRAALFIQPKVTSCIYHSYSSKLGKNYLMGVDLNEPCSYFFAPSPPVKPPYVQKSFYINNNKTEIKNFSFYAIPKLLYAPFRDELDGVIGLGLSPLSNLNNDFIDHLYESNLISYKIIYISFYPFSNLTIEQQSFPITKTNSININNNNDISNINTYNYCSLYLRRMTNWNCALSHILIDNTTLIEMPYNSYVTFTPSNVFSRVSFKKYYEIFSVAFNFDSCESKNYNGNASEILIICDKIEQEPKIGISINIGGIGIYIKHERLFQRYEGDKYVFMFCFVKSDFDAYTEHKQIFMDLGYFFFIDNEIALDFDKKKIGFRCTSVKNNYENMFDLYIKWKYEYKHAVRKQILEIIFILTFIISIYIIVYKFRKIYYQ
jgi:hypothetical protein